MKKLRQFLKFDLRAFLSGKTLVTNGTAPWKNEKGEVVGTRVETVILVDNTDYGAQDISNKYEKIVVKIPKAGLEVPDGVQVELVNGTGTVYGDYSQNLSVKADDIRVINQGGK